MKKIQLIIILVSFLALSVHAQHKISAYGGWTMSKLQSQIHEGFKKGALYNQLNRFPVLHAEYFSFEYEYSWKRFQFSTGWSWVVMGTSNHPLVGFAWKNWYITLPIYGGMHWEFPKDWGLTVETGVEIAYQQGVGLYDGGTGSLWGNINAVLGVEGNWKRFRFGTRLQIGVTKFRVYAGESTLRHSGLTTYIGYTLWDSEKAYHRRAKRLSKKHLKIE